MSLNLLHRHVLEDVIMGISLHAGTNHVAVVRRPVIYSVLAHAGHEASVAEALQALDNVAPRFCSPSEWLAVSQTVGAETVASGLSGIRGASFADQSDGRVLMAVSGPDVRRILAKCVAVDLHPAVFGQGQSFNMLCCGVAANVSRTGVDTFEIIMPRSYAGSVFRELMEAGREHALTSGFAD